MGWEGSTSTEDGAVPWAHTGCSILPTPWPCHIQVVPARPKLCQGLEEPSKRLFSSLLPPTHTCLHRPALHPTPKSPGTLHWGHPRCAPPSCSLTPPRPSLVWCHQAPRAARAVSLQIRAETPWGWRQGALRAAMGRRGVWDHCWDRNGKSINLQKYNSPHKTEKEKRHLICYQVHCESQVL